MNRTTYMAGAALVLAAHALWPDAAFAHHPTISATAECVEGTVVINYVSTSWSLNPLEGENPRIEIRANGELADVGAYVYETGNTFSGTVDAPPGESAVVAATAAADWGNGVAGGQTASVTVPLPTECVVDLAPGRFTGGGHQIRVGAARVTRGLTIHCDLLLSNNLEVNWGGNKFHTTEHLETVICSDDPAIVQAPPPAPLDTLVGVGTGRYNGSDGYTIEFTLVDAGEPGSADRAAFRIYETANDANVVLDVPIQFLSGGNLQAHYDQPHK